MVRRPQLEFRLRSRVEVSFSRSIITGKSHPIDFPTILITFPAYKPLVATRVAERGGGGRGLRSERTCSL